MDIIVTENLTKVYKGSVKAVDQLNLKIREGEIYGLLGPNGAGKTTTIKMLTTQIKPTGGTATVAGLGIRENPLDVRKIIGVVPQDLTMDEDLHGIENLLMIGDFYNIPKSVSRERAYRLLEMVDLTEFAGKDVRTYSGGMRKRLELVAGLMNEPKVLFLDEPTIGLDVQTRTKMWEYIQEVKKALDITIILTSHYLEEVDTLADTVSIMDHGVIKVTGTPESLKSDLKGDIIILGLNSQSETDRAGQYSGALSSSVIDGNRIRIKVESADTELPKFFEYLLKNEIRPKTMSVERPSLDQVFMEYTGKTIRDAEGGEDVMKQRINMRRMRS
ncbi:MAG: ATP-binding cassette domain-containing protein [Candidatus Thermoplasmatota archaeon]|nr:ATP-binding cassette domain-containing protein [Candidatus Thermoplasmatota archaeon]MCL5786396.1 ATP-binding cassette domain-containing protein [Candidatus Thermoplasmatota archaeon]